MAIVRKTLDLHLSSALQLCFSEVWWQNRRARSYRAHFGPSAVKNRSFSGAFIGYDSKTTALKTERNFVIQHCAQFLAQLF